MPETIAWDDDAAQHLRTRSTRYPGAADIDPAWTVDVVNDPERLVDEPDPDRRTPTASASSATPQRRGWSSQSWR